MADVTGVTVASSRAPETAIADVPDLGIGGHPELVFQPAVDLGTGRILGFEALLRWNVPGQGIIWPGELIPWAEACGHMSALNAWVMLEACSQALRWPTHMQVAVNCSTLQLHRQEAAAAAASALEMSGLNPDRLTIEVTENSLASEQAAADLQAMARMGIQLSVDDIGSEWSLLNALPQRAAHTVKIDGSLVQDLDNADGRGRTIVETIINLCRPLGICTVAECVETLGQVTVLRELHTDVAQGYFFSPPLSAEDAFAVSNAQPPVDFLGVMVPDQVESVPLPLEDILSAQGSMSEESLQAMNDPSPPPADLLGKVHLKNTLTKLTRGLAQISDLVQELNEAFEEAFPGPSANRHATAGQEAAVEVATGVDAAPET